MHNPTRIAAGQRTILALLLSIGSWAIASTALAGANSWTPVGPDGASLCAVEVAPSDSGIVYAVVGDLFGGPAPAANLYRSADGGSTWEPTGAAVGPFSCLLSVDAADPRRLYSIAAPGVWRSMDGGSTWASVSSEGSQQARYSVAGTQADSSFLMYANAGYLFRSRDGGDSWQESWPTPAVALQSLAIHPIVDGRVFAVTRSNGLFVSNDYGDNWSPSGTGLPAELELETVSFDPHDPSRLFLLTHGGIYRSQDGGASWSLKLSATGGGRGLRLLIRADSAIFAQLFSDEGLEYLVRSIDGGESWQELGSFLPQYPTLWLADIAASEGALLGASSVGVVKSQDDGASWQASHAGLRAGSVGGVAFDRENPERLYGAGTALGDPPGIRQSLDRGASWQGLPVATAPPSFASSVLVDPSDSRHLVLAAYTEDFTAGISSSFDGGATWEFRATPETCLGINELKIDPLQSNRLFLTGATDSPYCHSDCAGWRSEDAGESWQCLGSPNYLQRIEPSPFESGVVLAVNYLALYRSENFGRDWTMVAGPPDFRPSYFSDVRWASAETAYATSGGYGGAVGSAIFVTHDGGRTWSPDPPPPAQPQRPWLTSLVVDPFRPQTIAALAMPSGSASPREVVRSRDGGRTWESLAAGLLGWELGGLAIDPVTPNRLYVTANGGGLLAYDVQVPEPCVPSATALCITDGRFKIESIWRDFAGRSGVGHAVPLAADTGAFWFFDPDNLELFAKEIDGVTFNNAFWTFYGALSNVEFSVLATDTATGAQHGYFNRSAQFASQGDIESFPQEEGLVLPASVAATPVTSLRARATPQRSANACVPNATTLCLAGGRFAASVTWHDFAGRSGVGTPIVLTPDTGSFWFFDAGIHELAVKVIDGRGTNNAFWVFYGSLSNVEFELTVVDTVTGDIWTRSNPSGTFASGGDIEAFPQ